MKKSWFIFGTALALILGATGLIQLLKLNQRLGQPGLKVSTASTPSGLEINLPDNVLHFDSRPVETTAGELAVLPKDTTFAKRIYRAPDGFETFLSVVMMGTDRTSIHKPQFCLTGQGWNIDKTEAVTLPISRPVAYELPAMKLTATKQVRTADGRQVAIRGIYVYWFVADDMLTADHWERMWWMARELVTTGVLQRWSYVTYFSTCAPGQEETTFRQMTRFISASVPEFQITIGTHASPQQNAAAEAADALLLP